MVTRMAGDRVAARALLPLFLVAFAAVGVEIALTRYFAVASWSEYGYWIISIAMTGFAVSGVVMVLGREAFLRHAGWMLPALPLAMLPAGAGGWIAVTLNEFNPLALQNPATAAAEFMGILGYYAALFPFFFLAGLAVSLNFVVHARDVGRVYGFDLLGAGLGAALALAAMWTLHPFDLVPALLPALALAAALTPSRRPMALSLAALALLAASAGAVLALARPATSEYKAIFAPLNVPDGRVLAELRSPRGLYQLLDNFTERPDIDISNNAGAMGVPPPPRAFGLYRDGARIAALPSEALSAGYAPAALDAAPHALVDRPSVLLIGSSGGFRVAELGAARLDVVEPEPMVARILREGLGPVPPLPADPRVNLLDRHALTAGGRGYDIVAIAGDALGADDMARHLYAAEALASLYGRLAPQGVLSIPVSIRELPVYAVRVLATARAALLAAGVADPAAHVVVYRSAWNLRVLVSRAPWDAGRLARLLAFCEERSFDVSYAPGLDATAPARGVWNDLPPVSLDSGTSGASDRAVDAVAEEALLVMAGEAPVDAFDRSPVTADRAWLSPVVRIAALPAALARVEVLPQQEIGLLVNAAVLVQATLLALAVSALPLFSRRALGVGAGLLGRALVYFPALGLGFLLVEIALIEHAAFLLGDRVSGFALVLTAMLVFSGLGSMAAGRFAAAPRRGLAIAVAAIALWCAFAFHGLRPATLALVDLPAWARAAAILVAVAPLAVAMGLPFPIGLDRFQAEHAGLLPWAWALNGAFSVIATPLANLLGHAAGLPLLLLAGLICYLLTLPALPPGNGSR
jgi:hypothetical protein